MLRTPALIASLSVLAGCSLAGCGSAPPAAPAKAADAPTAAPSASAAPEEKPLDKLPTACEPGRSDNLCVPPAAFVKRLCSSAYPNIALVMLGKGAPWTRGYVRVKSVVAWNASGGESSSDKLVFDEEFVILSHKEADKGGMVVSGAGGGYDVLRWDGTCASLSGEEVSLKTPPAPKHAKIPWKILDDKVQEALLANEKVQKVVTERKKECKGASMGDVSLKCVKADDQLSVVIVDYVRGGGAIPPPAKLP